MSICLLNQNSEQLETLYAKHAKVIEGNFDTLLFLGSGEMGMARLISERIGDETVNYGTQSETRGRNGTFTQGESITKRRLMTPEEVRAMPGDDCIVFITGSPPIKDKKYMLERHPRFKETADYDKKDVYKI